MAEKLRFIQFGWGPIGARIARNLMERENVELEAAIDVDPQKVGRDVGEFIGSKRPVGVTISADARQVLANSKAEVVVLSTLSSFSRLEEQIQLCLQFNKNVVSSCEELSFPWETDSARAKRIDASARAAGVTILSNGVNPGFAMDALPIFLTSVCQKVDSIRVERHQDAALRRLPFQQKVGVGLSLREFQQKVEAKIIRHVGFTESVQMIARALGWKLERVDEIVRPAIAGEDLQSEYFQVRKGDASGVLQTATGYIEGRPVISIELQAYLGHKAPKDSIQIDGDPPLYSEVRGGFNGDSATCAMVANSVPVALRAEPGLKTMLDVGLTSWFKGCHTL